MLRYYYLLIKTNILTIISKIKEQLMSTIDVRIIDPETKKIKNIWVNYILIKYLNYLIKIINLIKKRIDIQTNKIEIIKNKKRMIVNKKDNISIDDIIEYKSIDDNHPTNYILMKFDIFDPDTKEIICFKKYLLNYRDKNETYQNTLRNIIEFNEIKLSKNSTIDIVIYKKGKKISHIYKLSELIDVHINYFYKININSLKEPVPEGKNYNN